MGSNTSKQNGDTSVQELRNELEAGCSSDPRSPTPEIIRTPLQGKNGAKHNITKNVDLRKTFENAKCDEKLIHNNPILSAVIKNHLQSYDPRSPTQDFERTPIVIATDVDEGKSKQQMRLQKNCASPHLKDDNAINLDSCEEATSSPESIAPKNLCDGFFDLSLNETIKDTEEPLGCSTASNEAIEENISQSTTAKPTELLETNFDYVGTESDKLEDSEENLSMSLSEVSEDIYKYVDKIKDLEILKDDPRSPSIGIERTPIVVSKTNLHSDDNVEDMSDDSLIKVLQNTNAELRQTVSNPQNQNSDGLLIYEDDATALNDTPKKSKITNNNGCRTPLSCMKNKAEAGHIRSKSANTLNDPKSNNVIPQKLSKRASHIPRLKSLSKQTTKYVTSGSTVSLKNIARGNGVSGDCENTPPHSHRDRWDKDCSIVL